MARPKGKHPVDLAREEIHLLLMNKILNPPVDKKAGKEVLKRISEELKKLPMYDPPLSDQRQQKIKGELLRAFLEAQAIMYSSK